VKVSNSDARNRIDKARKLLREADGMLAMEYTDAAGRAAYLAAFHAAQALISEKTVLSQGER
jgi:uncharacterized protein (UPF0332 family)